MNEANKLELWESVDKTDSNYTKEVSLGGRKFTAIDAYYQILRATMKWGPFGSSWGVKGERYKIIKSGRIESDKEHGRKSYMNLLIVLYTAILFYPDGEKNAEIYIHADSEVIFSSGKRKLKYNEDWSKKIATDALTKGLSKLGFSADVFLNHFNDNKYVIEMENLKNNSNGKDGNEKEPEGQKQKMPENLKKAKEKALSYKGFLDIESQGRIREIFNSKNMDDEIYNDFKQVLLPELKNNIKMMLNTLFLANKIDKDELDKQLNLIDAVTEYEHIDMVIEEYLKFAAR